MAVLPLTLITLLAPLPQEDLRRADLDRIVDRHLAEHGMDGVASVWIGDAETALYAREADVPRACASSIKSAYLVELFAAFADRLDEPQPAIDAIVADPEHPAVAHFDAETQAEIRSAITGVSVRRIGQMMVRGTGVSNAVYNAAANVTTALLGGPEGLTARMQGRAPDYAGLVCRRYMLARRDRGDNEVTAASLAAVLQDLAARSVPDLDPATQSALRDQVFARMHPDRGRHYFKSGALTSDPQCRIASGWFERAGAEPLVYVVMLEQPGPGDQPRAQASQDQARRLRALTADLLSAVER